MRETGVVRKLDALGRIVIPREYRKRNHIEIGDPVEMHALDNGDIIVRKVDTAARLRTDGRKAISTLSAVVKHPIGICSMKEWLLFSEKIALSGKISERIADIIGRKKPVRLVAAELGLHQDTDVVLYPLCEDESVYGALVILGAPSETEDAAARVAADLLVHCACSY